MVQVGKNETETETAREREGATELQHSLTSAMVLAIKAYSIVAKYTYNSQHDPHSHLTFVVVAPCLA